MALICLLLVLSPVSGYAKDRIRWLVVDWPPLMELDDGNPDLIGGQRGIQLKMLQESLPGYDHLHQEMSWQRFWSLVKKGENVCNPLALRTKERETVTEFSIPISIALSNHIVMRKETFVQLGSPASLSLTKLIQDRRFKGLMIKNRSYSHDIDLLLETHKSERTLSRGIMDEHSLLVMLTKKRMDYTLEYPFVVSEMESRFPAEFNDRFVVIPIAEIAPFYFAYVACPKTEWGKAVITDINRALVKLRPTAPFRNALHQSYKGEDLETALEYYDRHLLGINN